MTQEFVTLPREVVGQAIRSLERYCFDVVVTKEVHAALRAALEQPQDHVPDAGNMASAGWKLVPVEPSCSMVLAGERSLGQHDFLRLDSAYRAMLDAAPKPPTVKESLTVEQQQANQPAMTPIAQRKLEDLMASGYTISGYSVYHERKHQHGFVTGAGLVGWWKPEGMEYPQPQGEQEPVAWRLFDDDPIPGTKPKWVYYDKDDFANGVDPAEHFHLECLYTNQQNLNCKSTQARLATLWGYVKEQPKREPLTREQIDVIAHKLADSVGLSYRSMAQAIERAHNIK